MTPSQAVFHERHKAIHRRIEMAADRARWNAKTKADLARVSVQDDAVAICHAPEPVTAPAKREPWFWMVDGDAGPINADIQPTIYEIQKCTCRYYNISMEMLKSHRRSSDLVMPRHVGMYLSRELTSRSLPEIGRKFHRDHTVPMYAAEKIRKLIRVDALVAFDVAHIERIVGGRP